MAYVPNEEENKQNQPAGTPGASMNQLPQTASGTGAGATSPATSKAGSPQGAPAVPASTQAPPVQDLAAYLRANAPQAAQMGQNIAGNLTNTANQVQGNIANAQQQFEGEVNASAVPANYQETVNQAFANPSEFVKNPENVKGFQSIENAKYTGPTNFEGSNYYQDLNTQIQNAAQKAPDISNPANFQQLVRGQEVNPTAGQSNLDALLLQQSPEGVAAIKAAEAPYANLGTALQGLSGTENKNIADVIAKNKGAVDFAGNALGTAGSALNTEVAANLTAAQKAALDKNNAIKADLVSRNLTPDDLASLGITPDQWSALQTQLGLAENPRSVKSQGQGQFGTKTGTTKFDLPSWLTQESPETAITGANVASPEEYAKAQALETLANGNTALGPLSLNPADASQAGTAPTNLSKYGYEGALSSVQGTGEAELAAAQAYVNALQQGADENHARLQAQNAANNVLMGITANAANMTAAPLVPSAALISGAVGAGNNLINQVGDTFSSPTSAAENVGLNVATGGLYSAGQAVASGIKSAVNTIGNVFCFVGKTPVLMQDGTKKDIQDIQLGELTKGGKVLGVIRAISDHVYDYFGVKVSGNHYVKEDGHWICVKNSVYAPTKIVGECEVFCLVTEDHHIWVNAIQFADYEESYVLVG